MINLRNNFTENYKLDVVDPTNYLEWNAKLLRSIGYSIFHTSNWASVLKESYGFYPHYFTIFGEDKFVFLLPMMEIKTFLLGRKAISLPFTDYCQPVIDPKYKFDDFKSDIINIAKQREWKSIYLRSNNILSDSYPTSLIYYRHYLVLDEDKEKIFKNFRENYRSKIRRAIDSNISVNISHSLESLNQYYKLHCLTRQRQGLPPQSYNYFRNLFDYIIDQKLGFIILASVKEKLLAGAIFLHFGDKAVYKYGASNLKENSTFANYLLFWTAIQWLCENKYKELCFGRSELNHKGLIQFKEGWGTEKQEMHYYKLNVKKNEFIRGSGISKVPGYRFLRKVPLPLLRFLGSLVYRYTA